MRLYSLMMILFLNEHSGNVTFSIDEMGILSVDLTLSVNFDEDDPDTIIHVRLLAWCNRFEN